MALTPKQRKAALEKGFAVTLASTDDTKYLSPNPKAATQLFAKVPEVSGNASSLPADGLPTLPVDRLPRQTVDRQYYRQTVSQNVGTDRRSDGSETRAAIPLHLPTDGLTVDEDSFISPGDTGIPLAPVQWLLWQALCEADSANQIVSYRKLALQLSASIRGVRDAMTVIEKEGGVVAKFTVRTPDEQGMRIKIKADHPFRKSSLKETKALLKRENDYRQTVDRQTPTLPADGLRLSVCISEYIKQTDVAELLALFPPTWNIRERTLVEISRLFPRMTPIEFRRSALLLVEQAAKSRTQIQNHNAWLKAAFSNNEGPLVTERMINAQLDQVGSGHASRHTSQRSRRDSGNHDLEADLTALRKYVAADSIERGKIEEAAKRKAEVALRITPTERHDEIRQQALIEASREFFAEAATKNS
ncbi:MAG: hypothetical protein FJ147_21960 [Deltaproteobacteria bacterium]|nr:hypothetical protein [Deltaproteobacteria bacterium]